MRLTNQTLLLLLTLMLGSCQRETLPVSEDLYVTLLAESAVIQVVYTITADSALTGSFFQEVLADYGVTKEDFYRSHSEYQKNLTAQMKRWEKARLMLAAEGERLMSE